jgi:sulfatase modifying factor 1
MGCSPGDNECNSNEKPLHQVTITKGFWIGQTEVTKAAYERFAGATGRQMPSDPGFLLGYTDHMPIVNVTWNDAHDYCTWAGGRLPTEAEWEYAARGGSTEARPGDIDAIAWYRSNVRAGPSEVGQKRANGFGLFDMLGNVWEWVNDWYNGNYYDSSPHADPAGPSSGDTRVVRGGSWDSDSTYIRVSVRNWKYMSNTFSEFGIRCAAEVVSP